MEYVEGGLGEVEPFATVELFVAQLHDIDAINSPAPDLRAQMYPACAGRV